MLFNYFKIAWRSLWKNKLFSVINILGLGIAIPFALLSLLQLQASFETDNFHPDPERIYRAFVETQHLPCRAAHKIPADDGGIETRGCRTIACEQNGAHWPAMPAQIRCQRTRGEQETSGNPGGTADKIHAASRLQRAYRTIWRIGAPRKALL